MATRNGLLAIAALAVGGLAVVGGRKGSGEEGDGEERTPGPRPPPPLPTWTHAVATVAPPGVTVARGKKWTTAPQSIGSKWHAFYSRALPSAVHVAKVRIWIRVEFASAGGGETTMCAHWEAAGSLVWGTTLPITAPLLVPGCGLLLQYVEVRVRLAIGGRAVLVEFREPNKLGRLYDWAIELVATPNP